MRAALKDHVVEALIGLIVVAVAIGFVVFAWNRTQGGRAGNGYVLTARFPNVTGVSPGTDVRLAGIRVGTVAAQALDPVSYQAVLELRIDPALKLPIDSSAAITSEGVLGGSFIALTPGGDPAMLKPGQEIIETSGAADLMGLIGSFVNRPAAAGAAAAPGSGNDAAAAGAAAAAP